LNPDELIKSGLKSGNREVFKNLFNDLYPQLIRYSTTITADHESSRELVQDLFLDLWEKRNSMRIIGSVKTYLFTAIYHRSLNWIRNQRLREKYRDHPIEIHRWFPGITAPDARDPLLLEAIEKEIALLPDRCREVFSRFAIFGDKQSEIALALGISEKTTENHLVRARRILRVRLKNFR
jgi:RNA polymerase sigma-70 factor (ECF subfamily)